MAFDIPVLFIIFKRPQIAAVAFEQIKKVKPSKLYIACDAARTNVPEEEMLVDETKKLILGMIDWDCQLNTLYQEKNQGCANAVYKAISWLFANEEYGVILEDDCVPNQSFFLFTEELLLKYKNDTRVGMICGTNRIKFKISDSYVFSNYKACWGWATWKRAWLNMDILMNWSETDRILDVIENSGYRAHDIKYWKYRIKLIRKKQVDAWDWQWYFSLASQNQLAIFPKTNLIKNIGFGDGATHTSGKIGEEYLKTADIDFPMNHPHYVLPHVQFEKEFYRNNNTFINCVKMLIPYSVKNILKKIAR